MSILNNVQLKKVQLSSFNPVLTGKSRKQFFDEGPSKETTVEYSDFKINTYFVILDQLRLELEKRSEKYEHLLKNYNFFFKLTSDSDSD